MYFENICSSAPQGWQCPICGTVYSPQTPTCWYCKGKEVKFSTNLENLEVPLKVESEPVVKLGEVLAPIKEKIEELKDNKNKNPDANTLIRKEGYDLAIDDVIDLITMETEDKTVVIEITNPFCGGARCASCSKRETCEKKEN